MDAFRQIVLAKSTAEPALRYVVAFALIMLNTDQHAPSVKHRMTKEDFLKCLPLHSKDFVASSR